MSSRHISKQEKVEQLLAEIKNSINKRNVDLALPLLEWNKTKLALMTSAFEKQKAIKEAKEQIKQLRNKGQHAQAKSVNVPQVLKVSRGEIWDAYLGVNIGSEQNATEENQSRPVLIIQTDENNKKSPNTIIAPLSKVENRNGDKEIDLEEIRQKLRPTEVLLEKDSVREGHKSLLNHSIVLCQNIREISKERLKFPITHIHDDNWTEINNAIKFSLGIGD